MNIIFSLNQGYVYYKFKIKSHKNNIGKWYNVKNGGGEFNASLVIGNDKLNSIISFEQ